MKVLSRKQRSIMIIRDKIRTYVDKYAKAKDNSIYYSIYDTKSKKRIDRVLDNKQIMRIYGELYD